MRVGGLTPFGGTLEGDDNLGGITNSARARENLQVGGEFDLEFDATHGLVMVDRAVPTTKYRIFITNGNLSQEVV